MSQNPMRMKVTGLETGDPIYEFDVSFEGHAWQPMPEWLKRAKQDYEERIARWRAEAEQRHLERERLEREQNPPAGETPPTA